MGREGKGGVGGVNWVGDVRGVERRRWEEERRKEDLKRLRRECGDGLGKLGRRGEVWK